MLSFGTDTAPQSFCNSSLPCRWYAVRISARKSAVQVCKVAAVVMETTQLVLSQFKNFYHSQWRIEYGITVPKIISECCEMLKLCDINCSGPVFSTHYSLISTIFGKVWLYYWLFMLPLSYRPKYSTHCKWVAISHWPVGYTARYQKFPPVIMNQWHSMNASEVRTP